MTSWLRLSRQEAPARLLGGRDPVGEDCQSLGDARSNGMSSAASVLLDQIMNPPV